MSEERNPVRGNTATVATPQREMEDRQRPKRQPPYHVILHDDDDHTYEYVIEMLISLFGHAPETAFILACEVDANGQAVVDTTTMERAELKRDQIHAYGKDRRLARCVGSMSSSIEPSIDS